MRGRKLDRGVAVAALMFMNGCHGGIALHSVVLLVTLGIFIGTILLDRS
ncbi:MAG: hypothetical protein AAF500_13505 [Myxococcota bacterium]